MYHAFSISYYATIIYVYFRLWKEKMNANLSMDYIVLFFVLDFYFEEKKNPLWKRSIIGSEGGVGCVCGGGGGGGGGAGERGGRDLQWYLANIFR